MVGNREMADIAPAKTLGLRTILVAIEDPVPAHTEADAVATSLAQALHIISEWCH
jgi:FMN phosphatase YigB (HAD superfamily)